MTRSPFCVTLRRAAPFALLLAVLAALSATPLRVQESAAEAPAPAPADPAQWLVDYALSYGDQVTNPQPADAEYVLAWMEAAGRHSPTLAEAHLWRYDLLTRLNRPEEARAALAEYCRAAPRDLRAAFNLFELDIAAAKTSEQRIALCRERLAQPGLPPELASDLHRRLGKLYYSQGDTDAAIAEVRQAISLIDLNLPAHELLAAIEERLDDPRTRVQLLVTELTVNPRAVETRWRMADTLSALGLATDALAWYGHARSAFMRQFPESALPADLLLAEATAHAAAGDFDAAIGNCQAVLGRDPANAAAALRLIAIAREADNAPLAKEHTNLLGARLRELEPDALKRRDARVCLQIARYHLDCAFDPHRALSFARSASEFQPGDPEIRAVLGRALVETQNLDEAVRVLTQPAAADQQAAIALATALRSLDRSDQASAVLQKAARLRFTGPEFTKIRSMLRELHAEAPALPDAGELRNVLRTFDSGLLEFDADPAKTVRFDAVIAHGALPLSAPIWAELSLTNISRQRVTLGDERMVPARVAVSLRERDKPDTERTGYLDVEFNERVILKPGERTTRTVRLDTVRAQALLFHQPQRARDFVFTFVPAPQRVQAPTAGVDVGSAAASADHAAQVKADASGTAFALTSRLAGLATIDRQVTRLPVNASADGLRRLAAQLRTGSEAQRLAAIDIVLALVYEREEIVRGVTPTYPASAVDVGEIERMLLAAAQDPSAIVRARVACAFTYLKLEQDSINALAPLLSDAHWLPRMMACELFAKRQGKVFAPVLKRLVDDADPSVARLARLYQPLVQ